MSKEIRTQFCRLARERSGEKRIWERVYFSTT